MESKANFYLNRLFTSFKNQPSRLPQSTYSKFKKAVKSFIFREFELAKGSFKEDLRKLLNCGIHSCNESCSFVPNSMKFSNRMTNCPFNNHRKSACEGIRVIINHIAGMTDHYVHYAFSNFHSINNSIE
jgi:dGTP triphosphohydrolase